MTLSILVMLLCSMKEAWGHWRLTGEAGYREVKISIESDSGREGREANVRLRFCENQAWGQHHCQLRGVNNCQQGSCQVEAKGLKMSTEYTFFLEDTSIRRKGRKLPILATKRLETKGFSATASECLKDSTTVTVDTGPFFGGLISAEDRESKPGCSVHGDRRSLNSSYTFTLDHKRCGSKSNSTSVWTNIVVRENSAIMTFSTRKFLVLCHFSMPDAFTVKAAFNLPGSGSRPGKGSLSPVAVSLSSREGRRLDSGHMPEEKFRVGSHPLRIITAASLEEEARLGRMVRRPRQKQDVNERESRTLHHKLTQGEDIFGGMEVGQANVRREGDTLMLILVVGVAGLGGLVLTLCGLAMACRGGRGQDRKRNTVTNQEEEDNVKEPSEHTDKDKLQPQSKKKKRESIA